MTNIYLRFLICIALNLMASISHGQEKFSKGYIVLTNKDTINCLINDTRRLDNKKAFSFKKEQNDEAEIRYPIEEISSLYLSKEDITYFNYNVNIDKKPVNTDRLEVGIK